MLKNTYIVYGRVQGVGFRRFAQNCAKECNIVGWVKNLSDGNVEIEAVGEQSQISSFIGRISKGSWFSDVEKVEKVDSSSVESLSYETFQIIR